MLTGCLSFQFLSYSLIPTYPVPCCWPMEKLGQENQFDKLSITVTCPSPLSAAYQFIIQTFCLLASQRDCRMLWTHSSQLLELNYEQGWEIRKYYMIYSASMYINKHNTICWCTLLKRPSAACRPSNKALRRFGLFATFYSWNYPAMMAVANLSNSGQVFPAQNCLMVAMENFIFLKR